MSADDVILTTLAETIALHERVKQGDLRPLTAAVGAIAFQEVFDFTLQMPGAAALFVVLVAIAIHRPSHGARDSSVATVGRS